MTVESAKEYFTKAIALKCAVLPNEFKLTHREIEFLVQCYLFQMQGGDLNDTPSVIEFFTDLKMFKRRSDVAIYKYKISLKKWAITGPRKFILPPDILGTVSEPMEFTVSVRFEEG